MDIKLSLYSANDLWPRCFYDGERRCGERDPKDARKWHVADMCDCPSCPLRVAIRDALGEYKKNA